jgi:hypothetical protein
MHLIFFSMMDGQTGIPNLDKNKQLPLWEASRAQKLIDKCYDELFSPKARFVNPIHPL